MKTLFTLTIVCLISINALAQGKYFTKVGAITFEASVPSFEEVKASNSSSTFILNTENGEFAALVFVKAFRFKNALMEEHFNENYAESDKFPKATFKGKIQDFDFDKLNATSSFKINGTLMFHGKTKLLNDVVLNISILDDIITLTSQFNLIPSDFDIIIPKIVRDKVAENITVFIDTKMNKK